MDSKNSLGSDYILALHSSLSIFGVAILELNNPINSVKSSTFEIGRKLSNNLFNCIEKVFPKNYWYKIKRLAVSTGPGGFTGTRITITMARTIAQQLDCDIDGISSFKLMAPRLSKQLSKVQIEKPFWITETLNRRGLVAGKYQVKTNKDIKFSREVIELEVPHLISNEQDIFPSIGAKNDVKTDIIELINISLASHNSCVKSNWKNILPIYPTSPIDIKQ